MSGKASNRETCTLTQLELSNISDFLTRYDTLLLDCDGVLWNTDHITPFSGIPEAVEKLRSAGKKLLFVTNNSMHARSAYLRKFRHLAGFDAVESDVFGVAYAAAVYLKDIANITGKCYLIGGKGMATELESQGVQHVGFGADTDPVTGDPAGLLQQTFHPDVQAVLVAFDEYFSYNKLYKAVSYLSNPHCMFIATNDVEVAAHIGPGRVQPITGALLAAITTASKRQPIVVGKPHSHMLHCIQAKYPDVNLGRTIMIGDSLKTDISFAHTAGIDSLLVLSGSSNMQHVEHNIAINSPILPNYILSNFAEFGKLI